MTQFEYRVFWLVMPEGLSSESTETTLPELQKLGEVGWEACAKLRQEGVITILLLKREKIEHYHFCPNPNVHIERI